MNTLAGIMIDEMPKLFSDDPHKRKNTLKKLEKLATTNLSSSKTENKNTHVKKIQENTNTNTRKTSKITKKIQKNRKNRKILLNMKKYFYKKFLNLTALMWIHDMGY